jgi:hypothetical protein
LYHDPRWEGKRRFFIPCSNTSLFKAMLHCGWKTCSGQSDYLCITSEISANLFAAKKVGASAAADAPVEQSY